ncbi:MAG: alpha/beta fold hydrolase [Symploca sp. SIO2G7]|nr:alpha/beta fold hydrolase [Symploca sp. SIO2G7]
MPRAKSRPYFLTLGDVSPNLPLFIYLPGMDGTGQLLRSQTKDLGTAFDIRALAIPPDDLSNWEELTIVVVNLIEETIKEQPSRLVYLCGESFGGCLAVKVALRAPYLIDRIILSNPATSFNQRPWLQWGGKLSCWLPESMYEASAFVLLPFLSSLGRMTHKERLALLDAMRSVPATTTNWRISLVSNFDVDEIQLGRITQSVLIIASGADLLLPSVREAERLVNCIPNAKMLVLPQSGHACLLEKDVNFFGLIEEQNFLPSSLSKV